MAMPMEPTSSSSGGFTFTWYTCIGDAFHLSHSRWVLDGFGNSGSTLGQGLRPQMTGGAANPFRASNDGFCPLGERHILMEIHPSTPFTTK